MKSSTEWMKAILPLLLLATIVGSAAAQLPAPSAYPVYDPQTMAQIPYMAQTPYYASDSAVYTGPGSTPVQPYALQPYAAQPYLLPPDQSYTSAFGDGAAGDNSAGDNSAGDGGTCINCLGDGCDVCNPRGRGWFRRWTDRIFGGQRDYRGDTIADPRWFNINVEAMYLERDDVSRTVNFTQQSGAIVLSTDSLDFDEEPGFRMTLQMPVGYWSSLEASYFGTFTWASSAQVTGPGNLFSVFSNFGTVPAGGFAETDSASFHSISYSSTLHNVELNWRQRFMSENARVHCSLLAGVRYVNLNENFLHTTISGPDSLIYRVSTTNDLIGGQGGIDLSLALTPRLSVSGLCKAGLYGNTATQSTQINTSASGAPQLPDAANENANSGNMAFVGEAGVLLLYRISPCISITAGYHYVMIDGVALAPENFNANPAFGTRPVFINDNGNIQLHGGTAGIDWRW